MTKPVPSLPIEDIAHLLGLDVFALKELRKKKIITAPPRKTDWPVSVVTQYVEYLRGRASGDITEDAHAQRTRLLKEQADKIEMENAVMRENLVEVSAVERAWTSVLSNVRAKLLGMPTGMAATVTVENDQKIVKELLSQAVEQALLELSAIDVGPDREVSESSDQNSSENVATASSNG